MFVQFENVSNDVFWLHSDIPLLLWAWVFKESTVIKFVFIFEFVIFLIVIFICQVCHMYGRIYDWGSHSLSSMHAYLSHRLHWRLANAFIHLSFLYGTCRCSSFNYIPNKLNLEVEPLKWRLDLNPALLSLNTVVNRV